MGPHDKYTLGWLRELVVSWPNCLKPFKEQAYVGEMAPVTYIVGVPGLFHHGEFLFESAYE
jgi:hypothetical protein